MQLIIEFGYKDDNIVRPLFLALTQMSGYIKYFKKGKKNISFMIEDDSVLVTSVHLFPDKNSFSEKLCVTYGTPYRAGGHLVFQY